MYCFCFVLFFLGYERPLYTSSPQEEKVDTPFLSNFTKRLSQLSASNTTKNDYDYKNDIIKEHDANGANSYARSYLNRYVNMKFVFVRQCVFVNNNSNNFRPLRHRDLLSREFQTRQANNILKNNLVSFTVLAVAFLFFVMIAIMYLGIRNETSALDTSGKL